MLNADAPIPLYHQLADLLSEKIRSGEYATGSRIPSEHQLAATYGIGRPTARQATDLLVRKGLLVRKRGAGTFVTRPKPAVDVLSLAGTIASFEKQGADFSVTLLSPTRLVDVPSSDANPFGNMQAYHFRRLTRVENHPVLLEDVFLNPFLFNKIDRIPLKNRSLSQVVREAYFLIPKGGKQDFKITYLSDQKANIMAVSPKTPILTVNRYIHFTNSENGIYSDLYCRTDRFVFSQILGGTNDETGLLR